jgi:hypothetical protein
MNTHEMIRNLVASNFAHNYMLVAENDFDTYQELRALRDLPIAAISKELETDWETLLEQVFTLVEKEISSTAKDFLSQMLSNQGSLPFDLIAKEIKND